MALATTDFGVGVGADDNEGDGAKTECPMTADFALAGGTEPNGETSALIEGVVEDGEGNDFGHEKPE